MGRKAAKGDVKEMQKQCLDLADKKIALIEQLEQSLDSHILSVSTEIDKVRELLDPRGNSDISNGFITADTPKLAGSNRLQYKLDRT